VHGEEAYPADEAIPLSGAGRPVGAGAPPSPRVGAPVEER
jgi:hypothetical protein